MKHTKNLINLGKQDANKITMCQIHGFIGANFNVFGQTYKMLLLSKKSLLEAIYDGFRDYQKNEIQMFERRFKKW